MATPLAHEIRQFIAQLCQESVHKNAMLHTLEQPGFALHPESTCRSGSLTMEAYQAISGGPSPTAIRGAAGVELQIEAAYLFDSLGDQDVRPGFDLSAAEQLALAVAMLTCGTAAISEAAYSTNQNGSCIRTLRAYHQ